MKKKILAILMTVCVIMTMTVPVFAASTENPTVDYETAVKPIIDKILAQLSITNIVGIVAAVIGAGIAFVFLWWAIRKGISVLMSAIRKGKVSG